MRWCLQNIFQRRMLTVFLLIEEAREIDDSECVTRMNNRASIRQNGNVASSAVTGEAFSERGRRGGRGSGVSKSSRCM